MDPAPGLKFGHYELLARLGAGGMGEVWRARDHSLQREVAVKFIAQSALAHPGRLARFQREARAASALNHPNIVTIHEIGQQGERPFIVLELVQGRSLTVLMAGKPLSLAKALDIACQTADGLACAHAAGIVHRDLKPDNVMLTDDGLVKILDFGLAKLMAPAGPSQGAEGDDTQSLSEPLLDDTTVSKTREGVVLGTVGYMSPEQARGRDIDHRSDQFTLGSILFEMLAGHRAFQGTSSVETLLAIVSEEPAPPAPVVPPPLRWILERLLAKHPDQRYAATLDLARELRNVRDHLDEIQHGRVPSGATGPAAPAAARRPWARPRTWIAGGTIAVAALLLSPLRGRVGELLGVSPPTPQSGHVAVLPFKYVGADTRGQVLCEGLVDILNSRLTQLEQFQGALTVVPASEVFSSGITTPSAARRRFGATLVITGTVQESAGRVRAHASLVDAVTLRQVRSVEVEEAAGELFRLEDRLLHLLMEMLRMRAGGGAREVLAAGQGASGDAYGAYVQARGLLQRFDRPGNLEGAQALLRQAIEKDGRFALAHAALGEAYWQEFQQTRNTERAALARQSCERALALDPRLAPAYVTLAMVERGSSRPREALAHAERALGIDPLSADAHREKARALEATGAFDAAEQAHRKAVELRPNDWNVFRQLGGFLYFRGRYPEARAAYLRITELTPDNVQGWNNLGSAEYAQDHLAEAREAWETSMRIAPNGSAASNLGTLAFFQKRYADAARAFEHAVKERERDHRLWLNLASARYWAPGERGTARAAYEKALELARREQAVAPKDGRLLVRIATAHAMLGQAREARTVLAEALALAPQDSRVLFAAGEIHEHLGQRDQALRWIASALASGYSRREVDQAPGLAGLRADPRFPAAVAAK